MKVKFIILSLFFFFISPLSVISEERALVYVAEIDGEIKAGTVQYLSRVIEEAKTSDADYIVMKIDTPGGLLESTKRIIDLMNESTIDIIVFVNQSGGWAYSAGTFILMASDYAFSYPTALIGAAEPKAIGGGDKNKKIAKAMASWISSLAEKNNRDSSVAEKFVNENLTLNGEEAFDYGVINGTAENIEYLFTYYFGITNPILVRVSFTFFEEVFNTLSHPHLVSLFLSFGAIGFIFALRTGEFEISGILGIIFLSIGFWGIGVINFSVLGFILIILGITLLTFEMFGGGFGIMGILGVISLSLGIFNFEAEPFFTPDFFDPIVMMVMGVVLTFSLISITVGFLVAKTLKTKPRTGIESLIGLEAEVIKGLSPRGSIVVNQQMWTAESFDKKIIKKGEIVEIVKIKGNTVFVKRSENR